MRLRKYQQEIIWAVIECGGSPIVQLDTGAGKTPIIAALCASHSELYLPGMNAEVSLAKKAPEAY